MEKMAVHHLHVKFKGVVFTIFHRSDSISLYELQRLIKQIKVDSYEKTRA